MSRISKRELAELVRDVVREELEELDLTGSGDDDFFEVDDDDNFDDFDDGGDDDLFGSTPKRNRRSRRGGGRGQSTQKSLRGCTKAQAQSALKGMKRVNAKVFHTEGPRVFLQVGKKRLNSGYLLPGLKKVKSVAKKAGGFAYLKGNADVNKVFNGANGKTYIFGGKQIPEGTCLVVDHPQG